jgi:hypothetical protein
MYPASYRTNRQPSPVDLLNQINGHDCDHPIHFLYPDLLSLVASQPPARSLIDATHVSRFWRQVLLSTPSLWSDLRFLREEAAFELLERSGSTPISVLIATPESQSRDAALDLIQQHAKRLATLIITGTESDILMPLPRSPSLKKLDISCFDDFDSEQMLQDAYTFDSLTTLVVRGGDTFLFNVPLLTRLQVDSRMALDRGKLLDFLAHCLLLEELEVDYDAEVIPEDDAHGTVELQHLRFYSHSTRDNEHLSLFNKLSIPLSCVVFNYWNGPRDAGDGFEVHSFCNPSPLAAVKRIQLNTSKGDATVELIDAETNRVYMVISVDPNGLDTNRPNLEQQKDDQIVNETYLAYLKTLGASTVEVLCVEGPFPWMLSQAGDALSYLEEIETLVLSNSVATPFICALAPGFDDETGTILDKGRCDKLNEIVVYARSFIDNDDKDFLTHLIQVAKRRKEADIPIRHVSLFLRMPRDEADLRKDDIDKLRGYVWTVTTVQEGSALDLDFDDHFFAELDIRRDRCQFQEQRDKLLQADDADVVGSDVEMEELEWFE